MNTLSKFVLSMFFVASIGLALVVGQNMRESNNPETVPAEDTLPEDSTEESDVCTLEPKLCPDGSEVGRDPENNCEFSPCPVDKPVCGNSICEEGELGRCETTCTTVHGVVVCNSEECPKESVYCPEDCTERDDFIVKPTENT